MALRRGDCMARIGSLVVPLTRFGGKAFIGELFDYDVMRRAIFGEQDLRRRVV